MLSLEELRKYEWCKFADCRTNVKDKKSGARIGKYLACSGYNDRWRIYQIYGGLPILDAWVTSLEDAVKIAKIIDKIYSEYLPIYEVYPDWDLLSIARLSVPNGEAIYSTLCDLNKLDRPVNYNDFYQLLVEKMK